MQYYESISNLAESTEYQAVINAYIEVLENYVLSQVNEEASHFEYDLMEICDDLILVATWLGENNTNDALLVHNDEDFYEIYQQLSSAFIVEMKVYDY